jgi:hypothetical protein
LLAIDSPITIENILKLGIGAFSIVLLALSVSAYRKSGLKKIAYAAIAFALFAIQLFFEFLEDNVKSLEGAVYSNIISYATTLTILILFFLAIVKRK